MPMISVGPYLLAVAVIIREQPIASVESIESLLVRCRLSYCYEKVPLLKVRPRELFTFFLLPRCPYADRTPHFVDS